ncbi:MAG: YncE family protein, partial [Thermoleophilaceae bacterium]
APTVPADARPAAAAGGASGRRRRSPVVRTLALVPLVVLLGAGVAMLLLLTGGDAEDQTSDRGASPDAAREPVEFDISRVRLGRRSAPGAVAADTSGAYVVNTLTGQIVKVDGASMQVAGRIAAGREPRNLARDPFADRLWVAARADKRIVRIDTRAGERTGRAFVQGEPNFVAVPPGESLVVLSQRRDGSSLLRVNKETLRDAGRPLEIGGAASDLVAGVPGVAALSAFPPAIRQFSADLEEVGEPIVIPTKAIGVVPNEMVIDDAERVAWVTLAGEERNQGSVVRVDLQTGRLAGDPIDVGAFPNGIAMAEGVLWVADSEDGTVTRIDQETGRLLGEPVDVGENVGAIAVSGGTAWVSGGRELIRVKPE